MVDREGNKANLIYELPRGIPPIRLEGCRRRRSSRGALNCKLFNYHRIRSMNSSSFFVESVSAGCNFAAQPSMNGRSKVEHGLDPAAVRRIVVLRPNHRLGNALLLIPLIHELELRFPNSEIELVTTGMTARAIFEPFHRIKAIHVFPARSFRSPIGVLRILALLKSRQYDLAIDPIPRSKGGRFLLGQVRARRRIGFTWGVPRRDAMLTDAVAMTALPAEFALIPVHLLRSIIVGGRSANLDADVADSPLDLRLSDSERLDGKRRLATTLGALETPPRPCVGIFAQATGEKSFSIDWWRNLIATLRSRTPALNIMEFLPLGHRARLGEDVSAVFTPGLRLLGATLAATSLVVCADCGVMHLADAAGARVLGLFKTTEPSCYGPRGARSESLKVTNACVNRVASRIIDMLGIGSVHGFVQIGADS
jgi:heptosyltransferase III